MNTNHGAPVLVHGATGFTGRLICEALQRRGIHIAIAGRNAGKLAELARSLGGVESCVVDVESAASIERAIAGRLLVCACAGPFSEIGEPILAACARRGVHYIDTTAEQAFIARARERYGAVAQATGACIVPAIGYGGALVDWASAVLADRLGNIDELSSFYGLSAEDGQLYGTSRGSKLSALTILASGSKQWVNGRLVAERVGRVMRDLDRTGAATAVSFPAPDAVSCATHTSAHTVRSYVVVKKSWARILFVIGAALPLLARIVRRVFARRIARTAEGPDQTSRRRATFQIDVEARRGFCVALAVIRGVDPYGLTAEMAAYASSCLLERGPSATGVVAASVAFPARAAFCALQAYGVELEEPALSAHPSLADVLSPEDRSSSEPLVE